MAKSPDASHASHVALLRGINVGGKNKLPMRDLQAIFAEAGCQDVVTYIQSGNVAFRASAALARKLPAVIPAAIAERFSLQVPVLLRTGAEMAAVTRGNPFLGEADEDHLSVLFLADAPARERLGRLDPDRSPPDRFAVRGREVYLCCPDGMARTRLTNAWFDSQLATVSSARNWRTVLRLAAMTGTTIS